MRSVIVNTMKMIVIGNLRVEVDTERKKMVKMVIEIGKENVTEIGTLNENENDENDTGDTTRTRRKRSEPRGSDDTSDLGVRKQRKSGRSDIGEGESETENLGETEIEMVDGKEVENTMNDREITDTEKEIGLGSLIDLTEVENSYPTRQGTTE